MTDLQNKDSVSTVVVAVLALVLIVWGWTRAHAKPEVEHLTAPVAAPGTPAPAVQ